MAKARHIFRNKKNHIPDTPQNRKLIKDLASNEDHYRVTDCHGNRWYERTVEGGKQLWVSVRDHVIQNAGLNDIPRKCDLSTGLSRPFAPNFKSKC